MTRSTSERAADIIEAIERCQTHRAHLTDGDPEIVQMAFDAALRNLAIIGEAANHLTPDFTAAHPEIPGKSIVGMRHILVHQYFDVDPSIVIDALDDDLLPLGALLAEIR